MLRKSMMTLAMILCLAAQSHAAVWVLADDWETANRGNSVWSFHDTGTRWSDMEWYDDLGWVIHEEGWMGSQYMRLWKVTSRTPANFDMPIDSIGIGLASGYRSPAIYFTAPKTGVYKLTGTVWVGVDGTHNPWVVMTRQGKPDISETVGDWYNSSSANPFTYEELLGPESQTIYLQQGQRTGLHFSRSGALGTYISYEYVPEPACLALIGVGVVFLTVKRAR